MEKQRKNIHEDNNIETKGKWNKKKNMKKQRKKTNEKTNNKQRKNKE